MRQRDGRLPRFHGKTHRLKAQIIGVSVNDPFSNKAFAEKQTNLSDTERLQPPNYKAHGVETPVFGGLKGYVVAKRSIFIINKKGVVRYAWTTENPETEPDYEEIEKALEKTE